MNEIFPKVEAICSECKLKDSCYMTGEIQQECPAADWLVEIGYSAPSRTLPQMRLFQTYKWERSKKEGRDIGHEQALDEWRERNYDYCLTAAVLRDCKKGFRALYEAMVAVYEERAARRNRNLSLLASTP